MVPQPTRLPAAVVIAALALSLPAIASASPLTVWPLPATEGDDGLAFELCVHHDGAVPAQDVRVVQPLASASDLVASEPAATATDDAAVWVLGTLAPGEGVCVSATVSGEVAPASVEGVAGGLLRFTAARAAAPAQADAPEGSLNGPFDTYVLAEVARLEGDAERIIDFVRDEIAWVPYDGAMRGARGTLWAREGNALDRATLLVQMLRAAGTPARFARGTLDDAGIDTLLASMQPDWNRIASHPVDPDELVASILDVEGARDRLIQAGWPSSPDGLADRLRDELYDRSAERSRWAPAAADHWWPERFDGTWQAVPTLLDTLPAADETHLTVPSELLHTVTIEVLAEVYNPAFFTVTGGFDTKLEWTAPTAELVGRPATLWIESDVIERGGLVFGSVERDYFPTLRIGGEVVATGDAFTELITNFPLASTFVLGVEMNVTLTAPDGSTIERTHVVSDRLGAAARTGYGGDQDLSFSSRANMSGLTGLDTVTVTLGAGAPSPTERLRIRAEMASIRTALEEVFPQIDEIVNATEDGRIRNEADQLAADTALRLGLEANTAQGELLAARYLDDSALFTSQMAQEMLVTAWDAKPRLVISGIRSTDGGGAPFIDLARHDVEVWAPDEVPSSSATMLQLVRSEFEAELETASVAALAPPTEDGEGAVVSLQTVWTTAQAAGIPIRELQPGDEELLARLDLDLDARARMDQALRSGLYVFTPDRMVALGDVETVVWIELDPSTGRWTSVGVNGWRMAAFQYASMQRILSKGLGVWIGGLHGFSAGTLIGISQVLDASLGKATAAGAAGGVAKCAIGSISPGFGAGVAIFDGSLDGLIAALIEAAAGAYAPGVEQFISGFNTGFCIGMLIGHMRVQMAVAGLQFNDPPVPQDGSGALDPWRRPLWVARDAVNGLSMAHTPPATGPFAGTASGTIALADATLALDGAMTVSGAGLVVIDDATTDEPDIGWTIDRWSGPVDSGSFRGEVGVSAALVSLDVPYLDATSGGFVDVRRVLDDGSTQWVRLEGGDWRLEATGARGAMTAGSLQADAALLASGPNAWPDAAWTINAAARSLDAVATTSGVTLGGVDATTTQNVGARWTVSPTATGDALADVQFGVEAPAGWRVELTDAGYEVWPRGAGAGTYLLQTWLEDGGVVTARQETLVTLADAAPALEVELWHEPLYTVEVGEVPYPMVARAIVRNAGGEPVDVSLATEVTGGFRVAGGWDGGLLGPGEDASMFLSVVPDGDMPAAGGDVSLSLTATADGVEATDSDAWTVPTGTGVSMASLPVQPIGLPGASGTVQVQVTGRGNAMGTVQLRATPAADITYDGLPESFAIMPDETRTFDLTWTLSEDAKPGLAYGAVLEAFDGERRVGMGVLTTFVVSPPMEKAFEVAELATFAAPDTMADELGDLGLFLADFSSGCNENDMRELEFRLNTLAAAAEGIVPALIVDELRAQADVAADSGYSCAALDIDWLCATLEQLGAALEELDEALGQRLFLRDLSAPTRVVSGELLTLTATLSNEDTEVSEPSSVRVSTRQRGAAVEVGTVDVPALAAGESFPIRFDWPTAAALGSYVLEVSGPRNELSALVQVDFAPAPDGNAAPVFAGTPPERIDVGVDVEIPLEVSDPDGDAVYLTAAALPSGFRLEGTSVVGKARREGALAFSVLANDRYGAAATLDFDVTAAFSVENEPPFVTSTPPRRALVGVEWSYLPTAFDPDATEITWRTTRAPAGTTTEAERLSWTPTGDQIGVQWFDLDATDADGNRTVHSFPVTVAASPIGADLAPGAPTLQTSEDDGLRFSGSVDIDVTNGGDQLAAASRLSVRLGNAGGAEVGSFDVPALGAGERVLASVSVAGDRAFPRQPLAVVVDADDDIDEADETNNERSTAGPAAPSQYAYMAAPPTEAQVVLLASDADVAWRILDPATRQVASEGIALAGTPVEAEAALRDGDSVFPLSRFLIETDGPVQAYVVFEVFDPEVGGDLFHPARDGSRVGREFFVYVPTASGSNGLFVMALEDAEVVRRDADGVEVERLRLAAGQTWEVEGIDHGEVLQLSADGDLVVQSSSVTGAIMVPPTDADSARRGDVGRSFVFSTRSRGLGGGALGVVAYEDASFTVDIAEGTLLSGSLQAGESAFYAGVGELRGARLSSTGDVSVLAGDIARLGADRIGLMGEDLVQTTGRDQRAFVVHTLENDAIVPYAFAGPQPTTLSVDGETTVIGAYERHVLPANAVVTVEASAPIVVQTMGGGDRYYDYAAVLPTLTPATGTPDPVLHAVTVDDATCGTRVGASARVGNAGAVPVPAGATLSLVRVVDDATVVVATYTLDAPLASGDWIDATLEAAGAITAASPSWIVRLEAAGVDPASVTQPGSGGATCTNDPPVFETTPPSSVPRGEPVQYTARAVDPEGSQVRYDLVDAPAGTSLHPTTGRLEWAPAATATAGDFAIAASDDRGGIALQSFRVGIVDETCLPEDDGDSDGVCPPADCDDTRDDVFPGNIEIPGDGLDNDCDPSTSDAIPPGGVTIELTTAFPSFARGASIPLEATLTERTSLASFETLEVTLVVRCADGEAFRATASEVMLDPGATTTVPFVWPDADAPTDRCTAVATVANGALTLDTGSLVLSFVDGVEGRFDALAPVHRPTEPLSVAWTVENTTETSLAATIAVRRADRVTALHTVRETIAEGASLPGSVELDTGSWPQAPLTLQLVSGDTLLDEVDVTVLADARVAAPEAPTGRELEWLNGSDASAVAFRPDGPTGSSAYPAAVQAAWSADGVALAVTRLRDDVRSLSVTAWRDGQPFAEQTWTPDAPGDAAETDTPRGPRLSWLLDGAGALEPGLELGVSIVVEAGDQTWWWVSGPSLDAADAATIELLDGDVSVADPSMDAGEAGDGQTSDGSPGTDTTTDSFSEDGTDGTGAETVEEELSSGCDCRTASGSRPPDAGLLLIAPALLLLRRRRRVAPVLLACAVVGLAACGGGSPTEVLDATIDGTDGTDGGTGGSVTPGDAGTDGTGADGGGGADGGSDAGFGEPPDAGAWVDAPGETPGDAAVGEDCESDADCASGICQQGVDYAVCTERCDDDECPDGFSCEPFPGGVELCVAVAVCLDDDGDGYGRGEGCDGVDCDDRNANVHAGMAEVCDGLDNDCDGDIDEGVLNACGACGDVPVETCNGFDDDCDGDIDEGVANACGTCGAVPVEICNGLDDDCDGTPDEGVCLDCELGASRPCYAADPDTEDVGLCAAGVQRCESSGWSVCVGATLPVEEICNGVDDDCDGEEDEGLLNACGTCGAPPVEICNGEDDDCDGQIDEGVRSACGGCTPCGESRVFPFERGEPDPTIAPAPDGAITLGTGLLERHDIWVPNSNENTVSRWDTRTGRELARYWVGADPSRTAVDLDGNVWVGNRGDGIVTHIFGDPDRCIDRNGDGVIQTSRDLNGDGLITGAERLPQGEGDALADECVHCQVRVGTANDLVRGVGVDAENHAWVGTWNSQELYQIDPETCDIMTQISTGVGGGTTNRSSVYGIAIDPDGYLWTSGYTNNCMPRVDTRTGETLEVICDPRTRYGMAASPDGRIWYGGANSEIHSYTPSTGEWATYTPPEGGLLQTTGIVVDARGVVYVAGYSSNNIGRFDPETGTWQLFATNDPPAGFGSQTLPRGVTIDAEGHLWAIARGSSGLVEMTAEGEWIGSYDIVASENPATGTSPYSYSDNTGFQLFNIVAREGVWRDRFDVGAPVRFLEVDSVTVEPDGTSVELRFRIGDDTVALNDVEWTEWAPASGITDLRDVAPEEASIIDLQYRLRTDDPEIRPVLRAVTVRYETEDCRLAATGCPSGQICDPVYGGCFVPPTECSRDAQCSLNEYCDDTGSCRLGCRLTSGSCPDGRTCDPESHRCLFRTFECATDAECASGSWCTDSGYCEEGCRLAPDSCPVGFDCEASTRSCEPIPPECVLDANCDDGTYCDDGRCVPGCRADGSDCAADLERCDLSTRLCVPLPEACDPEAISDEVCDGIDNDCNGEIDDLPVDVGVTCTIGAYLDGTLTCSDGAPVCQHDGAPIPSGTAMVQYASRVIDFSSQRFSTSWSAAQALGVEGTGTCNEAADAWAPSGTTADPEFLHLGFEEPLDATTLRIREVSLGGFVTQVDAVLSDGSLVEAAWAGVDETPCGEWLDVPLDLPDAVAEVIIHTAIDGRELIDAVQLIGSTTRASDPILLGPIGSTALGATRYRVAGDQLRVDGVLNLPDGATLERDGQLPWDLFGRGDGDSTWGAAELVEASMDWRPSGSLVATGTVLRARPESDRSLYFTNELVRFDGVTIIDVPGETIASTPVVMASSRLVSTSGTDFLWTARGTGDFVRTEFLGENTIPRRTNGLLGFGPLALTDVDISQMQIGLELRSDIESTLRGTRLRDSDVNVNLISNARATFSDVVVDLADPGHYGAGIVYDNTSPSGGVVFDGITFRATDGDQPIILDLDAFHEDSVTTWGAVTFEGLDAADAVALGTAASAGPVTLEALPFTDRLRLDRDLTIGNEVVIDVGDVELWATEDTRRLININAGSTARFQGTRLENVALNQNNGGGDLTVDGVTTRMLLSNGQSLITVRALATVTNSTFASLGTPSNTSNRIHTGVYVAGTGDATVTGSSFSDLQYGMFIEDDASFDVAASDFVRCQTGVYIRERATGTLSSVSFTDDSELVASLGVDLRFDPGGWVDIDGATFTLGADDRGLSVEPDVFSTERASTFDALVFGDALVDRVGLRGDGASANIAFTPVGGESRLLVYETLRLLDGTTTTIDGGVTFESASNGAQQLHVGTGASLTTGDGTSFIDLWVRSWGEMTATGTRFEGTGRSWNPLLEAEAGTIDLADATFIATVERGQDGLLANAGTTVTVDGAVASGLDEAIWVASEGTLDASEVTFENVRIGISTVGACTVEADASTFVSGPDRTLTGVYNANPADGLVLTVTNSVFDLEAEHAAVSLPYEAFLAGRSVTFSGSTEGDRGLGLGYVIYGTNDEGPVTLGHLEAAQPAWRLTGNLTTNGTASLTIPPGTRFVSDDFVRVLDFNGESTFDIDGAEFEDIQLRADATASGTVNDARFTGLSSGRQYLNYLTTTGAVTLTNTTYIGGEAATATRGIETTSDASAITIDSCTFESLEYGIYARSTPPVVLNPTYIECTNDSFGLE